MLDSIDRMSLPSSGEPSWTRRFSFSQQRNAPNSVARTEGLEAWLSRVRPKQTFKPRHLQTLIADLEKVEATPGDRVIYVFPPRHGKTTTASECFPVWCLKRHPEWRIIGASYAQSLANRISRRARKIAVDELDLSGERGAVQEWETAAGGGYRAVGVGAGITGHGGDLEIIDDPVKNRQQADSEVYREMVWEWWKEDLSTRLEPGGRVVLIQTRWHSDDLAGRILADDPKGWRVVHFPAIANGTDWRAVGEALWPERYDVKALERIKRTLGPRGFSALYQGSPIPEEGAMFKREWFKVSSAVPTNIIRTLRYWDFAATEARKGKDPDWTAGPKLGLGSDGKVWVLDVKRMRGTPGAVKALVKQTAQDDGPGTEIWIEQEPGSSGKFVIDDFVRDLMGYYVQGHKETGDPVNRVKPTASQAEIGNMWLLEGAWNREYLDEFEGFPYAKHDDQVSSTAGGLNKLALTAPAAAASSTSETELRANYGTRANYGGERLFGRMTA